MTASFGTAKGPELGSPDIAGRAALARRSGWFTGTTGRREREIRQGSEILPGRPHEAHAHGRRGPALVDDGEVRALRGVLLEAHERHDGSGERVERERDVVRRHEETERPAAPERVRRERPGAGPEETCLAGAQVQPERPDLRGAVGVGRLRRSQRDAGKNPHLAGTSVTRAVPSPADGRAVGEKDPWAACGADERDSDVPAPPGPRPRTTERERSRRLRCRGSAEC